MGLKSQLRTTQDEKKIDVQFPQLDFAPSKCFVCSTNSQRGSFFHRFFVEKHPVRMLTLYFGGVGAQLKSMYHVSLGASLSLLMEILHQVVHVVL